MRFLSLHVCGESPVVCIFRTFCSGCGDSWFLEIIASVWNRFMAMLSGHFSPKVHLDDLGPSALVAASGQDPFA